MKDTVWRFWRPLVWVTALIRIDKTALTDVTGRGSFSPICKAITRTTAEWWSKIRWEKKLRGGGGGGGGGGERKVDRCGW